MQKWTIQVFYNTNDDQGKSFRATSVTHVEAESVGEAYAKAEEYLNSSVYKLGAILPGEHLRFP